MKCAPVCEIGSHPQARPLQCDGMPALQLVVALQQLQAIQ